MKKKAFAKGCKLHTKKTNMNWVFFFFYTVCFVCTASFPWLLLLLLLRLPDRHHCIGVSGTPSLQHHVGNQFPTAPGQDASMHSSQGDLERNITERQVTAEDAGFYTHYNIATLFHTSCTCCNSHRKVMSTCCHTNAQRSWHHFLAPQEDFYQENVKYKKIWPQQSH